MKKLKLTYRLLFLALISISVVIVLFLLSENKMHRNNAFVRRFPHQPIIKKYDVSINYNSYYISGYEDDILYLGNTTAPLHLLKLNLKTRDTQHIRIQLENSNLPFRSVNVQLYAPYFFIMDGTIPVIFRGKMGQWQAKPWMKDEAFFTKAIPIDTNKIFLRTVSGINHEALLGTLKKSDHFQLQLAPELLEKQIDGLFDVDGIMTFSPSKKILGYVYFYRNQYMIMSNDLKLLAREHTIDTIKNAQIQISKINKTKEITMTAPPLTVNKTAAIFQDILMINSNRLGKYEEREMLQHAAIIDVYNWKKQTYLSSFYIYTMGKKPLKEFMVFDHYMVALIDDMLSVYEVNPKSFPSEKFKITDSL